jgi:phosphonate transport system permease protein
VAKQIQRGLLILASLATIVGIFGWRVYELARREATAWEMFQRAFERRELFVALVVAGIVFMWALNVYDAWRAPRSREKGRPGVFLIIGAVFFVLGWQISEIDAVKMVAELPDAWPPLSRVLWPWEAAITYDTSTESAAANIRIGDPEEAEPPEQPPPEAGEPQLTADPTVGFLSEIDEQGTVIPGTVLELQGTGFKPNTRTEIWWIDPIGNEFRPRQDGEYVATTTDADGDFTFELVMPYRLVPPSATGPQIHTVEARQVEETGPPLPSEPLRLTIGRMIETIFLGMMATVFGILLSIPVSFLAARNIMSGSWITMGLYYLTRTILNIVRSIEPLIWALIAVVWVGLGPFAGIIALTIHSIAALGKLYSEAIEGIDPGPIEAIQATGANRLQTIAYAVIPQMISPFISFSIYRWDINVRMSTVIGLVGGGGIGFLLVQYIRLLDYRAAGIAVWFIAITVAILDYVSAEIRNRLV